MQGNDFEFSFDAFDESGQPVQIDVFVDIVDIGTRLDPGATAKGLRTLRTKDGRSVNRIAKGRYEIVQSGVKLRSDDPASP